MTRDGLRLTSAGWDEVVAHLASCLPEEGCGLLGGRAGRVELVAPVENAEHSPVHYRMEPRAQVAAFARLEQSGLELLAAFHSHPAGPFGVSQRDVLEWQYPEAALIVCAPREDGWSAHAFLVTESKVTEIPLQVEES